MTISGEYFFLDEPVKLNEGREATTIEVTNTCLLYTSDAADE